MKKFILSGLMGFLGLISLGSNSVLAEGLNQSKSNEPNSLIFAKFANGEEISQDGYEEYVARRVDFAALRRNAWGAEHVVREMAMLRVLNLEGISKKIPYTRGDVHYKYDEVYAQNVQKEMLPVCELPEGEGEAKKYFDQHPEAFLLPIQVRLHRVILPVEEKVDGTPAMTWLFNKALAVSKGEEKFSNIARQAEKVYILDPQGDIGWVMLEDANNGILNTLKTVQAGEMLGPVQDGDFGYLFLVADRREARQLSWDEAKNFAAARAQEYCRTEGVNQLRNDLFKKYGVEINRDAIRAMFRTAQADAAPATPAQPSAAPGKTQ